MLALTSYNVVHCDADQLYNIVILRMLANIYNLLNSLKFNHLSHSQTRVCSVKLRVEFKELHIVGNVYLCNICVCCLLVVFYSHVFSL